MGEIVCISMLKRSWFCCSKPSAGLPLYLGIPGIWQFRQKKNLEFGKFWKIPGKTFNFEQKSLKNLEFLIIFTSLLVKFCFDTKKLWYRQIIFDNKLFW